jgi:hypothetical protein
VAELIEHASEHLQVIPLSAKQVVRGDAGAQRAFQELVRALDQGITRGADLRRRHALGEVQHALTSLQRQTQMLLQNASESTAASERQLAQQGETLAAVTKDGQQVQQRLQADLATLSSTSRVRLRAGLLDAKNRILQRLPQVAAEQAAPLVEGEVTAALEAELRALEAELADLCGQVSRGVSADAGDVAGDLQATLLPTDDGQWADEALLMVGQVVGMVLFGFLGLLAGPLLLFYRIATRREARRARFEQEFEAVVSRLVDEVQQAIVKAEQRIEGAVARQVEEKLLAVRTLLEARAGKVPTNLEQVEQELVACQADLDRLGLGLAAMG